MEENQQLLPPGFRFYPTEEELISFFLHHKLHALDPKLDRVIPSVDIYKFEPSELPGLAGELCNGDPEQWFFFNPRQEREARGGRPTRTTATGYWKATGSPTYVYSAENNKAIGMKKTMVFYQGKAPTGRKTKWKMNEYKAVKLHSNSLINHPNNTSSSSYASSTIPELRHEVSLCRVYITSGCARAFDRRPPPGRLSIPNINQTPPEIIDIPSSSQDHRQPQGSSTVPLLHLQNDSMKLPSVEKSGGSSSNNSSNSGGNCHGINQAQQGVAGEMADDDHLENFWDLEPLNWQ